MPQIINTNIASLNAQRNLNLSQNSLAVATQRLSSMASREAQRWVQALVRVRTFVQA